MIRSDNSVNIDLYDIETFSNKESIRKFLLHTWAEEKIYKKYRYFVELLDNNQRIYLERPGRLNKGCDFVIFVENQYLYKNGNDKPPSHDYVFNDLAQKNNFLVHMNGKIYIEQLKLYMIVEVIIQYCI